LLVDAHFFLYNKVESISMFVESDCYSSVVACPFK